MSSDAIVIAGLRTTGRVGVTEAERSVRQDLIIDLTCWMDLAEAARRDDLAATVDYRELAAGVRRLVRQREFHLLEAVAEAVAGLALEQAPVARVEVAVTKPALAGPDLASVGVRIERSRAGQAIL